MSWSDGERETLMQESSGQWKLWVFDALGHVVDLLWSPEEKKGATASWTLWCIGFRAVTTQC